MKVKVRTITAPYVGVPTASLQAVLRNHAHGRLRVRVGTRQLIDIMGELVRRRDDRVFDHTGTSHGMEQKN